MRKLKFRAYSKSHNKIFDNELLENAADGLYNIAKEKLFKMGYFAQAEGLERGVYLPTKDNDLVFMEYTGLKDKNGKEIYEGDILKCEKRIFIVEYAQEIATFVTRSVLENGTSRPCMNIGTMKYAEVIGNIYENPELLG